MVYLVTTTQKIDYPVPKHCDCKDTHYKFTNRDKNIVAQHIKEVLSNESNYDYLATRETLPDMKEGETLFVRLPGKTFLALSHFKWD